jgi:type IV pilus assembly protein PilB
MFKSNIDSKSELNIMHMLLEHDQLTNEEYKKIKKASNEIGKTLIETGVELKFINEDKILHTLASTYSLEVVDLISHNISEDIINILDDRFIKQHQIAPFEIDNQILKIAIPDGSKLSLVKTIEKMSGKRVEIFAANLTGIHNFVERITNKIEKSTDSDSDSTKGSLERNETQEDMVSVDDDVIEFGNKIIGNAVDMGASDIHIECFRSTAKVRYRIDGILREMDNLSAFLYDQYDAIVARIKIISKLDIAERRIPQDGAASFSTEKKSVDLRVSVLPTKNKERVVMRVLDKSAGDVKLEQLGFEPPDLEKLTNAIKAPQGMVLVTGPTGSGKTTTLYSILKHISTPEMNILTAEDPVEYELDGIGQVQIKESIGYTFEEALRSFLRQDPEVILVGEIRDQATVEIALKASLTGHLVFSTLHTNDAPSSITRLLNMGTPNYLISAALTLVMAQRLARKNCSECAVIDESITPKILSDIGLATASHDRAKIYKGKGCDKCGNSGYKGRMGIYEILVVDRDLKNGILQNLTQTELTSIAKKNGFRTMQEMGHDLLLSGDLSYAEFDRVIPKVGE